MAHFDSNDSKPLMMQHGSDDKYSLTTDSYPEVVPAENLKANTIRHDDSWYYQQNRQYNGPPTTFSPLSHSNSTAPPWPNSSTGYPETPAATVPLKGFRKTSRRNFALLVALVVFLFTALALGAGLGIPLAKALNKLSGTKYKPLPATKVDTLSLEGWCTDAGKLAPDRNQLYQGRLTNSTFSLNCGAIYQEGQAALNPASPSEALGTVRNILATVTYRVEDCIQACASFNDMTLNKDPQSPKCQSITFVSALSGAVDSTFNGNCFLKNSTLLDLNQASISRLAISAEVSGLRS